GTIKIDLIDAIERIRAALVKVKPKGGPDYDRFVSDAVALRVAETKQKERSSLSVEHDLDLPVLSKEETRAHETAGVSAQLQVVDGEVVGWPTPRPIRSRSRASGTEFPLDAFPRAIRDVVREVAKATQMSEAFPALAALGALSASTAGGFKTDLHSAWDEGLSLYLVGVADPSERKTAALKPFVNAFRTATQEWESRTQGERSLYAAKKKALETAVKAAEKNVADEGGVDALAAAQVALDTHVADGHHLLVPNAIVHADPTQEALIHAMSQQHGVGFIASSEGAFIANLAGRYSSGSTPDLSLVNEAYSRSFIRSTRVTRGDTTIPVPHLAIVSFIQPSVAERFSVDAFESTGFLSRVLYTHPESLVGERETKVNRFSPLYGVTLDAFADVLTELFVKGWGREEEPIVLRLDPEAIEPIETWWRECEALTPRNPWWGKAHGNTIRVASLLALADNPGTTTVGTEFVIAAIRVIRYFAEEMSRMRDDVLLGDAVIAGATSARLMERLLKAIARRWDELEGAPFTLRDVQRWLTVGHDEAFATAEALTERGWLVASEDAERRNSIKYLAHPSTVAYVDAGFDVSEVSEVSEKNDTFKAVEHSESDPSVRSVRESLIGMGSSSSSSSS
ncbi:MAG: DUF3987 domain-containing protein, partial [Acidimicrobiia bacterium]